MESKNEFRYFYGTESDTYVFYRIPKVLITGKRFRALSNDAKILYGLMLDRMSLSVKNSWFDDNNRVFIYYSMEEVMIDLNCSKNKALKSLSELDTDSGIGLIERVKQGQGKPTIIYVKNFMDEKSGVLEVQKREVKSSLKGKSGTPKKGSLESQERDTNKTNINNIEISNTESNLFVSADWMGRDSMDVNAYAKTIRDNLEIDLLIQRDPLEAETLEGIYELVLETVLCQNDDIIIAGSRYPISLVKGKFMRLNSSHVEYVIDCLKANTTKVRNIRKYMLASLFNAPTTISSYYQAEVNHDFPMYAKER